MHWKLSGVAAFGNGSKELAELYHQLLPSNWHEKFLSIWCGVQHMEQMDEALAAQ